MSSIFNVGLGALNTAQAGLMTASHNIANANTQGYNRQEVVQAANQAEAAGSGFLGSGVHVETVKRLYSSYLQNQGLSAQAQASQFDSFSNMVNQVDTLLSDNVSGVSGAIQGFFGGLAQVAADPASIPARQALLGSTQSMVDRFHMVNDNLTKIRQGVNDQITGTVSQINNLAKQIAQLNTQIVTAQGGNNGQPPNDLLDQRDQAIADLNKAVKVSTFTQSDGAISVFIGSGQSLVVGDKAFQLQASAPANDPLNVQVSYQVGSALAPISSSSLQGGSLGGVLNFRSQVLDPTQDNIGKIALEMSNRLNAQHQQGVDLNDQAGGNLFNDVTPKITAMTGSAAAGNLAVRLTGSSAYPASAYTVNYDPAKPAGQQYFITRLSDNQTFNSTTTPAVNFNFPAAPATGPASATLDGIEFTLAGAMTTAGSYTVTPADPRTAAGAFSLAVSDPAKIAAAAPFVTGSGANNSGSAQVSSAVFATSPGAALPTPLKISFQMTNVTDPVTLAQTPTLTYSVTDDKNNPVNDASGAPMTNIPYTPSAGGLALTVGGVSLNITGAPNPGDTLTVDNSAGGDNRNMQALAKLQNAATLASGASFQDSYGAIVSQVGTQASESEASGKAQANIVTQVQQSQQSISGVNLDEEAANLLKYQQIYQAAGKVIQIANTMFSTLLSVTQSN